MSCPERRFGIIRGPHLRPARLLRVLACVAIVHLLAACGSDSASTEVENELASVSGTAAVGKALALATVTVTSVQGEEVVAGITDTSGNFALSWTGPNSLSAPWLLTVIGETDSGAVDTLRTPFWLERSGDSLHTFQLVNPLTDWVLARIEGDSASLLTRPDRYRTRADALLQGAFAPGLGYAVVSDDPTFIPSGTARPTSPTDLLLHSLAEQAALNGVDLPSYLTGWQQVGRPLLSQEQFTLAMLRLSTQLGVDSLPLDRALELWLGRPPQGLWGPVRAAEDHQSDPALLALPPQMQPLLLDVLSHAAWQVASVSPEGDTAALQANLLLAADAIAPALWALGDSLVLAGWSGPHFGDGAPPLAQECGRRLAWSLAYFNPNEWGAFAPGLADLLLELQTSWWLAAAPPRLILPAVDPRAAVQALMPAMDDAEMRTRLTAAGVGTDPALPAAALPEAPLLPGPPMDGWINGNPEMIPAYHP